jgi:hypothetical protein
MRRIASIAAALAVAFLLVTPVALAADPSPGHDQVLLAVRGDVTLPADQTADVIVVVQGNARLAGTARTVVVVDGTATLDAARVETLWAIRSTVELQPGTVVTGDVLTFDSTVHKLGNADVQGAVTEITPALVAMGAILAPVAILFWLGFGLATIVAGLFLAGIAGRQVRATERLISNEPVPVFVVGIAGLIALPTVAVLLMISILGAPLGLGILFMAWPFVAYLGFLVAGIWVGDWILARTSPGKVRERPFLASVVGLVVLQVVGIIPIVGLVSAVASLFGFGAVLLAGWRTLTGGTGTTKTAGLPAPAPMAS